jgi:hypothetical protein
MSKVLTGLVDARIIAVSYRRIEIRDAAALRRLAVEDDRIWR